MDLQVVDDSAGVAALRLEWTALLETAVTSSVFLTPEWLGAWWGAFGGGLQMHLVAVRDGGRLVGLAPLAMGEVSTFGRRRRAVVGWSNDFTDRFGLVVDAEAREAVEALARHLADLGGWGIIDLHPLVSNAPVTRWLQSALRSSGCGVGIVPWWESPIVQLPGTIEDLSARLGGSFRSTLRRKVRAGEKQGLLVEMRRDAAALQEAFAVSRDGWAHREGTGICSTPEIEGFYRNLAGAAEERGWLRVALLRREGRAIAFELNLVRSGAGYNLKLGYRDSESSVSPGLVLRSHVMESLIAEGVTSFDLLGSAESYKLHWTDRVVPHVRMRAFPPTLPGRAAHLYRQRLRPLAGRALNRARRSADGIE